MVFGDLLDPDFGVVFFAFELEFDAQADNLGILEAFGLLFEAGVGEGFLESDAVDEEGVLEGAASDFFDADEFFVEVVLVEGEDGVDDHYIPMLAITSLEYS